MKKFISFILVLSLLVSVCAFSSGCGDSNNAKSNVSIDKNKNSSSNSSSTESNTESSTDKEDDKDEDDNKITQNNSSTVTNQNKNNSFKKIDLFTNDEANFTIIRSNEASVDEIEVSKYAYKAIYDTHNISVDYKNDSVAQNKDKLEINIGLTNRPKSQEILNNIKSAHKNYYMDYSIIENNNVIYIIGGNVNSLKIGVKAFLSYFCYNTSGKIEENFEYKYHINEDKSFAIDGKVDLTQYNLVVPKYNLSYIVGREVNTLSKEIMLSTGSNVERIADSTASGEYEIVIGNANRADVPMPTNTDEYVIKMLGNKLFVIGGGDASTACAVKTFIQWVKDGRRIPKGLDYSGSYELDSENFLDTDYKMSWNDEFDSKLDTTIWNVQKGLYSTPTNDNIAPRKKMFSDKPENIKVENGNLVMKGSYDDEFYYGTEIRTPFSLWMKYGIIEISCKMNFSKGICPAFWLLGNSNNAVHGEFDCFEGLGEYCKNLNGIKCTPLSHVSVGNEAKYGGSGSLYCNSLKDEFKDSFYSLDKNDSWDSSYHTIGLEWTPTTLSWIIDGDVFFTIDTTKNERSYYTFNGMMQIVLTHYSGNDVCTPYTGVPDSTTDWANNNFTVDYIRLYQNKDGVLQK